MGGSLVAGILTGDAALIGKALDSDAIVEPVRGPLIPGFAAVKEAAKAAGKWEREAWRGRVHACVAAVKEAAKAAGKRKRRGGLHVQWGFRWLGRWGLQAPLWLALPLLLRWGVSAGLYSPKDSPKDSAHLLDQLQAHLAAPSVARGPPPWPL